MSGNVRASAVHILCLSERGGFADALLDSTIEREVFKNPADSALLTEIVMGTLRHRMILDHLISKYLQKGIEKTDEFVRNAIRVGAYQILFLSRIPPHAAIFETVEIVKRRRGDKLAGLTNGVLRNFQRELGGKTLREVRESEPHSVRYSLPSWMIKELKRYFEGEQLERVLDRLSSTPPTHVRINRLKGDKDKIYSSLRNEGVEFSLHPVVEDCLVLQNAPPMQKFRPFQEGLLTPQDAGSVLVTQVVAEVAKRAGERGGRLLDLCSAPGIKASYLAALLPGWDLWATDVSTVRIDRMKQNFKRMEVRDCTIRRIDFTEEIPPAFREAFDVVFVDAPCSGLGVMRRNPEVKWRIEREDVHNCGEKAMMILENALSCVKRGGFCIYATCTFTGRENEDVVKIGSQRSGCVVESIHTFLPDISDELNRDKSLISVPDLLDSDFFYLALLRK